MSTVSVRSRLGHGRVSGSPLVLITLTAFLTLFSILPLVFVFWRSLQSRDGAFVGLRNYQQYFEGGGAYHIISNTLTIAVVSTVLTIVLAYLFALCLTHTCVRFKALFRGGALLPLLTPTLLSAMALTQLFGTQGYLNGLMMGHSIYGPIGIIVSMTISRFPHVFLLISTAITLSDSRLYEAAESLKSGRFKAFLTITLPATKYGLISSSIVCFTLCVTDFAIPKVIGGEYAMLATEIYKQVVGQMNFQTGAVVSMVMFMPALAAFFVDRYARKRQQVALTSKSVPFVPRPRAGRDALALAYCVLVSIVMVAMIAIPAYASFVKFWPYNLGLTLRNYHFDQFDGAGWQSYFNSLRMAILAATAGTVLTFSGAWLVEKSTAPRWLRDTYQSMTLLPLAVPGLVLGLAMLLYLNASGNPLGVLYGTMSILVITTIIHYYTVSHFIATTSLRQLDPEFELISDSLKASRMQVLLGVTLPLCVPALLDTWIYLFLSAMNTVSAAIFLYSPHTMLASVAVVNMDDAGSYAPAAAMATTMVATCIVMRIVHLVVSSALARKTQKWRGS
ncbi:putative 2-aminoethylphosphonate ABC transporter permease subunit [Paraburkholderia aromaticivorans]|uniref:putative 2-aminoethylphosphonate ABC transporter permease subunit n=1 Tax=Paraburkholderia aromaticivorans TaxID=2026199 RepID=UPI0014561959|nr:putative 2-aminoethylphosphonate ABC transporter permease subunit [Paraburkholderia aromaticivorans]